MKVTFDSNVWRIVSSPDSFTNEPSIAAFRAIHNAICGGSIQAHLSETVFTLEAISRSDRREFFASYRPKIEIKEEAGPNGLIHVSFAIGPDLSAHPGNTPHLTKHWDDAEAIGFRLMHCTRIATTKNPDVSAGNFVSVTNETAERFGDCARDIEAHGCGIFTLKQIGLRYAPANSPWQSGISAAPEAEDGSIAAAVAEWADGDTVAAHYAYTNDYLCTRDTAKSAGSPSVFSASNREWLRQNYGVQIITPEALCALV